jgi:rod shape-determining protein MreD
VPTDLVKRTILFFAFVLIQAVILGRIHLFGVATPLLYVYFVTMFPRNYPKWAILLWSFLMGLLVDTSTNTPGLATASLTLIAVIQPYFVELFVPRDSVDNLEPSLATLDPLKYSYYVIALVLLYCLVFYSLEMFNFFNLIHWALCVGGSTVITLALIFTFEIAKNRK